MGEIRDKVVISQEQSVETEALFDSGATISLVDEDIAKKAGLIIGNKIFETELADSRKVKYKLAMGVIKIRGCESPLLTKIFVDAKPADPCIIGTFQMELMGITLDPENRTYTIKCRLPRV